MGSAAGAERTAAIRVGVSVDEYRARRSAGEKWCYACRAWHPTGAFVADRRRGDGRKAKCLRSDSGRPRGERDRVRELARRAVGVAVRFGRLPRANDRPCVDCGHVWRDGERRHEYDHYLGYEIEHRLAVEPVCTTCHADREKARRDGR